MASTVTDRIDGLSTSTAIKAPVRVATTANITLSGLQTIDGVTVVSGDRVLVKNQTDTTKNGIYVASASAWERVKDFDGARDAVNGTVVLVRAGTENADQSYRLTTADPVSFGSSSITWERVAFGSKVSDTVSVETVTALRLLSGSDDSVAIVRGHFSELDGGEGVFILDSDDSSTSDNGGTVIVDTSGNRWKRVVEGDITPKMFGAPADNSSHPVSEFFGTLAEAQAIYSHVTALTNEMDWVAIQAALNTGKNVQCTAGTYWYNQTIQLKVTGQSFWGSGQDTCTLHCTLDDNTKNGIEITGNGSVRRGIGFGGFHLKTGNTAQMKSLLFVSSSMFETIVGPLRVTMTARPDEAVVILDSASGTSYPNTFTFRNVALQGTVQLNEDGTAASSPVPIKCGFWLKSAIEGIFDHCEVYQMEVGWRLGDASGIRNVADIQFNRCQSEIGVGTTRANGTDAGISLEIYQGTNLSFYACKFTCGADLGASAQRVVVFKSSTVPSYGVAFSDTLFWNAASSSATANAIEWEDDAVFPNTIFSRPHFDAADGIMGFGARVLGPIYVNEPYYITGPATQPIRWNMAIGGVKNDFASIADGGTSTVTITQFQPAYGEPLMCSASVALSGLMPTVYRTSGFNQGAFSLQNETGGAVDLAEAAYYYRRFRQDEVRAVGIVKWNPASLATGIRDTTTVTIPGAAMGDMASIAFAATNSGALNGIKLHGWVSAANTITAQLTNLTATTRNLAEFDLIAYLLAHKFDYYNSKTYDPPSLATLTGTSTTITVTGARVGDFCNDTVSFTNDQAGVVMWGEVTADDTVTVYLFNGTTGTVDLASGTLAAGVYKRLVDF